MSCTLRVVLCALVACAFAARGHAQDLYDTTVIRTFDITFHDADWLTKLRQMYASETPILADLVVDGEVYPDVGVRIRGNTSYTGLPSGSQKFSLKVYTDWTHPDQEVMGYSTLNLNNGWRDPTFCREVVYNNYVAQFIPHPRSSHAVVTLNGENWGVYVNSQQPNKSMLGRYFENRDGMRVKCSNNPFGPGLRYSGSSPSGYRDYEIQNDGGLADPWGALIAVCNAVTNGPLATWEDIDALFAIDPSIWSVVLENMLTDDDSYVNKGCDFMTYRDPLDGRTHLLQRDSNETFSSAGWSITRNFSSSSRPVLSHVLTVPELRQRYMAHYRTVQLDLDWSYFGPQFEELRALIDEAVQADPKKLYSYDLFQRNFTETVTLPYFGLPGGTLVGLEQFINQRADLLAGQSELMASGPSIHAVQASSETPAPGEPVIITASVSPGGSPVRAVELFYRPSRDAGYLRTPMIDVGSGEYEAELPIEGEGGQVVSYYVAASSDNAYGSLSFLPELAERGPMAIAYTFGAADGMRITEWMYSGDDGEFVEFTNMSADPIDMTGWSMDDDHLEPGAFDLSAFGTVQPGESVVVTEAQAETFRAAWGLGTDVKIIGELGVVIGNNFGRNDQINLYDAADALVDRLSYGDQTFPGTIRTQTASGQTCREAIGQDDVYAWELSAVGDVYGSLASAGGDVGTPGSYNAPSCEACYADCDGSGALDFFDFLCFQDAFAAGEPAADCDGSGDLDFFDFLCFQDEFAAGCE